jgi:ribosomal protein S18 acetylase RimI-like enzyme
VDVVSLGYRTDLMLRVLGGAEITDRGSYLVVRTPANPAFWWGNFILLASPPPPGEAGLWLSRFAAEFPGADHVALGIDVTDANEVTPAEFTDAGLRLECSTVMTARALYEPPRPNRAAKCRQLDGDDDWRQSAELTVACDGLPETAAGHAFLERRTAELRGLAEAGHGAWFGAFLAGRLACQLGVFSDGGGIARFQNVETHPATRRQGLAGTLVCEAGRYGFDALGARMLVIVADPGDVAARIYRSVGFADTESQVQFERAPAWPGDSVPGDSAPGDSVPGDSVPGDSVPGDSVPGDSASGDWPPP